MIFFYKFLTVFFYPLLVVIIFLRKILGKEDEKRYKEKIFSSSIKSNKNQNENLIWFHAASIGEIQSITNLIREYEPNYEILITTVTKTAASLVKETFGSKRRIHHRFFPIDTPFIMKKFLNEWSPKLIIFVDSEIWPNLLDLIEQRKIKTIIVNARITKKTFLRWKKFNSSARKLFSTFDLCIAANKETFDFLNIFKARNVKYFGNLKFSNNVKFKENLNEGDDRLLNHNLWCAVSTHKGEDNFFLNTHVLLKKKFQNLLTIIAPRHLNRCDEIQKLSSNLQLQSQILNKGDKIDITKDIIIINSIGNLNFFLNYAKSVFMGKSLLIKLKNVGGQNPIQAAKLGCKIYHGPYIYNFQDVYNQLKMMNISIQVNNEDELFKFICEDFDKLKNRNDKSINLLNELGENILNKNIFEINKVLNNVYK